MFLTKHQRKTLEHLRDELREKLYSRADEAHGGNAALRLADRNGRLRDQIDALQAALRVTAGEGTNAVL